MRRRFLVLTAAVMAAVAAPVLNAEVNLNTCKGCHGENFEKAALGKSKLVFNMSKEQVSEALIGYKRGTYGGTMKGVMLGQVSYYSIEDLNSTGLGINYDVNATCD